MELHFRKMEGIGNDYIYVDGIHQEVPMDAEFISRISGVPFSQIQFLATMISSSITYLAMFGDVGKVYNGYDFKTDDSWEQLEKGINLIVDKWI